MIREQVAVSMSKTKWPVCLTMAVAWPCWTVGPASAHFNMLLPDTASAKRGEPVTFLYQWGHPFEHQLFNAPAPKGIYVVRPDKTVRDLTDAVEKTTAPAEADKATTTYRVRFTPDERGDFLFVLTTQPIWMEEDQEFLQDTVNVVLHVQAQNGWDHFGYRKGASLVPLTMLPLTRPYGLQAGMVFQAQARDTAQALKQMEIGLTTGKGPSPDSLREMEKPLGGALVEIERYNPKPPTELPADEHITRTAKTDPNGVVTCTLPEPGWWCITAQRAGGEKEHNGKLYRVKYRATLWVFVDDKLGNRRLGPANE
jgi:cobalt/nickel transport protein